MKTVILKAGHHFRPGAPDPGAAADGYQENILNRKAKQRIAYYLNAFYPELTVLQDDDTKTLPEVLKWIREVEGTNSIAYSFHWNSASTNMATGVETFVSNNASKKSYSMAKRSGEVISKISGLRNRGVKTESQSNRGRIGFLSNIVSPAVLIELGFINNPNNRETFFEFGERIYITLAHEIAYQAMVD